MAGHHTETAREFNRLVSMRPAALETWLGSEESKQVGWTHEGEHESVGHRSGARIVEIKRNKETKLTDDYAHMAKVVGYIHRHMAQDGPRTTKSIRAGAIRS